MDDGISTNKFIAKATARTGDEKDLGCHIVSYRFEIFFAWKKGGVLGLLDTCMYLCMYITLSELRYDVDSAEDVDCFLSYLMQAFIKSRNNAFYYTNQ